MAPPRLPFIWHVWINLNMPINLLSCALCLCAHRDIIQLWRYILSHGKPNLFWEPPTKYMFDLIAVSILFCCMKNNLILQENIQVNHIIANMRCQLLLDWAGMLCWVLKTNSEHEQREIANTKTVCITVAAARGLDVRQGSISDYRDTVTGPRADTTNLYHVFWCIWAVRTNMAMISN